MWLCTSLVCKIVIVLGVDLAHESAKLPIESSVAEAAVFLIKVRRFILVTVSEAIVLFRIKGIFGLKVVNQNISNFIIHVKNSVTRLKKIHPISAFVQIITGSYIVIFLGIKWFVLNFK